MIYTLQGSKSLRFAIESFMAFEYLATREILSSVLLNFA